MKVAVLRGGVGEERTVSMKTGEAVLASLKKKHQVTDVVIDMSRKWFVNGSEISPKTVIASTDVVFNALHGEYGEDGTVQNILDSFNAKYTGPKAVSASLAMNKLLAKEAFKSYGLKSPVFKAIERKDLEKGIDKLSREIFTSTPMPAIIKPINSGSSLDVFVVSNLAQLQSALEVILNKYEKVLIEEFVEGVEITCGVLEKFRNDSLYALPPVEIKRGKNLAIFDFAKKYEHQTVKECPAESLNKKERETVEEATRLAHTALGLRHYSRSDFIVSPKRGVYILETNALPGLSPTSLYPIGLRAVGSDFDEFVEHVISLAYKGM